MNFLSTFVLPRYLGLCFLGFAILFPHLSFSQDSAAVKVDTLSIDSNKVRIVVQVANQKTMEPMKASVRALMGASGHVVAIGQGDETEGFVMNLPIGAVYIIEAESKGFRVSGQEIDLSKKPEEDEITVNLLLGTSGGYVQPDDIDAPYTLISSLYFKNTSVDLDSTAMSELRRIYILLRRNPSVKMVLLGHADVDGSIYKNVELSELRARQTRAILISKGIAPFRLRYFGYGNAQPVSGRVDERGLNNRVDFHLIF
ncbi:MAG: OmpA family protein [Bacteroidia bacterium]|nr:OmpA family protein [Bacteroidia bacterium]